MMEAKIMKYNVLSWSIGNENFGRRSTEIELSFCTDILLPEQVKKLVHSVHESAPFYLT